MKNAYSGLLLAAGIMMATGHAAWGQEKVRFFDRKAKPPKEMTIIGVIQEESPARIRIKPSRGEARTIPVNNDLMAVGYKVSTVLSKDYRKAQNRELDSLKRNHSHVEKNA